MRISLAGREMKLGTASGVPSYMHVPFLDAHRECRWAARRPRWRAVAVSNKEGDAFSGGGVRTGFKVGKGGNGVNDEWRKGYGRHAGRGSHVEEDENRPVMMEMETSETENGVDVDHVRTHMRLKNGDHRPSLHTL